MTTLLYFVLTLAILVTVHEFGHYWVARRCGVKVLRFSVGFGSPLYRRCNGEGTEFVVAAIPLGGYVKMLDEREGDVEPTERHLAFNRQSLAKRAAIVLAGPLANFILAVFVYWWVFVLGVPGIAPVLGDIADDSPAYRAGLEAGQRVVALDGKPIATLGALDMALFRRIGDSGHIDFAVQYPGAETVHHFSVSIDDWLVGSDQPDPYGSLGIARYRAPIPALIDEVVTDSPASRAGFQAGDRILAVNAQAVDDWRDATALIAAQPGQRLRVEVDRDGGAHELFVTPDLHREGGVESGRIGISVVPPQVPESMRVLDRRGPSAALAASMAHTGDMIVLTLDSIKKMLVGLVSPANLGGPIAIAKIASSSAASGLVPYLSILALLSVSLGVLNLLPIPVLDGGHLLFIIAEAALGRPVPEKIQLLGQQAGLFLILGIMMLALYNDLSHL